MSIHLALPAEIRNARPDSVKHIDQLTLGTVLVGFSVFGNEDLSDVDEVINPYGDLVARVLGTAYRITGDIFENKGICVPVEQLPTYSFIPGRDATLNLFLGNVGIMGIEENESASRTSRGLLIVSEEPYAEVPNLEIAPGLYINGANDEATIVGQGHYAVAMDYSAQRRSRRSDPSYITLHAAESFL